MNQGMKPGQYILVIDGGWVMIGMCDPANTAGHILVQHAKILRQWGTTQGLGEILTGPTAKTVADPLGVALVPLARILFALPSSWKLT